MNNKVSKLQKWQVLHYQPEMLNELLCIPEVSITQLTVGVIGHHVHLPLLLLIEVRPAELALGVVISNVCIELLSSVGGKLQGKRTPPSLHVTHNLLDRMLCDLRLRSTAQTMQQWLAELLKDMENVLLLLRIWCRELTGCIKLELTKMAKQQLHQHLHVAMTCLACSRRSENRVLLSADPP